MRLQLFGRLLGIGLTLILSAPCIAAPPGGVPPGKAVGWHKNHGNQGNPGNPGNNGNGLRNNPAVNAPGRGLSRPIPAFTPARIDSMVRQSTGAVGAPARNTMSPGMHGPKPSKTFNASGNRSTTTNRGRNTRRIGTPGLIEIQGGHSGGSNNINAIVNLNGVRSIRGQGVQPAVSPARTNQVDTRQASAGTHRGIPVMEADGSIQTISRQSSGNRGTATPGNVPFHRPQAKSGTIYNTPETPASLNDLPNMTLGDALK